MFTNSILRRRSLFRFALSSVFFLSTLATANAEVFSPEQAIEMALEKPLVYLGDFKPKGMVNTTSCVWRNENVVVLDTYCSSRPTKATRLAFYSPSHGEISIYVEVPRGKTVQSGKRSDYWEDMFDIDFVPPHKNIPVPAKVTLEEFLAFHQKRREIRFPDYCKTFGKETYCNNERTLSAWFPDRESEIPAECDQEDVPRLTVCRGNRVDSLEAWQKASEPFWDEPPSEWKKLTNLLVRLRAGQKR